jgi:putative endonuclease
MMFVYILECADRSYYVGVTNDLSRRITEHVNGLDAKSYTNSRRPVKLVFSQDFPDPHQAIAFEKQIKGWTRRKKEALICGDFNSLKITAKKRFNKVKQTKP